MQSRRAELIRVFVVAPPLVSWGLQELVKSARSRFELVGAANSFAEARSAAPYSRADVMVIDLDWPHERASFLYFVAEDYAPVVALTEINDPRQLDGAMLNGPRAIVHKREPPMVLHQAIETVANGGAWSNLSFMETVRDETHEKPDSGFAKLETLTARQRAVFRVLISDRDASAKAIASRLSISSHTLRAHLSVIYSKFQVRNRVALYLYALNHKLGRELKDTSW